MGLGIWVYSVDRGLYGFRDLGFIVLIGVYMGLRFWGLQC